MLARSSAPVTSSLVVDRICKRSVVLIYKGPSVTALVDTGIAQWWYSGLAIVRTWMQILVAALRMSSSHPDTSSKQQPSLTVGWIIDTDPHVVLDDTL